MTFSNSSCFLDIACGKCCGVDVRFPIRWQCGHQRCWRLQLIWVCVWHWSCPCGRDIDLHVLEVAVKHII